MSPLSAATLDSVTTTTATVDPTLPLWAERVELPDGRLIRQARPDEYPAAEDLLVAAFTTGCWVSPDYEHGLRNLPGRAETFRVWVAVDADDRLLGIVLTPRVEYLRGGSFSFSILAVGPHGRGLGLGSLLVDHAIKLARAYGFSEVEINSSPQMSAAHRLYYSKGFVRRLERETMFVSEYDERLLTFTYRITDPLPVDDVLRVAPQSPSGGRGSFHARRPLSSLPPAPPGLRDESGAFVPDPDDAPILVAAGELTDRLRRAGRLAAADPDDERVVQQIEADLWAGAHTVLWSADGSAARTARQVFFARLDALEAQLARAGSFLAGDAPGAADVLLFRVLLAYDLGWRAAFPWASGGVADWPRLWNLARWVLQLVQLSTAERVTAGLVPDTDGTFVESFGVVPPVFGLPDLRQGWGKEPDGLRRRRPPRTVGVPGTPWDGPLPAAATGPRGRLAGLAAEVAQVASTAPTAEAALTGQVQDDLVSSLIRLASGADGATQQALRRLFFARLAWFDQRVAASGSVGTARPAPEALLPVLRAYREWLGELLPPIDPVLEDYPALASWLAVEGECP